MQSFYYCRNCARNLEHELTKVNKIFDQFDIEKSHELPNFIMDVLKYKFSFLYLDFYGLICFIRYHERFCCFFKTDDDVRLWMLHNHVSHRLEKKSIWRSNIRNLEFFVETLEGNEQKEGEGEAKLCEIERNDGTIYDQERNSLENEPEEEDFSVKVVRLALPVGELEPEFKAMKAFVSEFSLDSKENILELKRKLHEYYGSRRVKNLTR